MTQAQQFDALCKTIIEEYQKAAAPILIIFKKYLAQWNEADGKVVDAQKAYNEAERAAYQDRCPDGKPVPRFLRSEEYNQKLQDWEQKQIELLKALDAANHEREKAETLANLAGNPLVNLQAVQILKIYAAFFKARSNVKKLKKSGERLKTILEKCKDIAPCYNYPGELVEVFASAYVNPFNYEDETTPERVNKLLEDAQKELAAAITSEAEILSRAELIDQARTQLKAFKATYEKSASELYKIMDGLKARTKVYNELKEIRIDTYCKK